MNEEQRFTFVNEYGETIEAWKGDDGKVYFTHSDASPGEHFLIPGMLGRVPWVSDVVLSPEELYFLLGVWLGKVKEG